MPYWPEREKLINVLKESGYNRVRSQERREKALRDYLQTREMTLDGFHQLEELADRPFYLDGESEIVIPAHHVYGMLANGCDLASAATRIARRDAVRSVIQSSDWRTGKTEADGIWERFAVVTGGAGKLSNQRALRSNPYIENFVATGTISFIEEYVKPQKLRDFLEFCGRDIGIGASRKMGWGRFVLKEFD